MVAKEVTLLSNNLKSAPNFLRSKLQDLNLTNYNYNEFSQARETSYINNAVLQSTDSTDWEWL
jgi:hypothetical protein